MVRGALPQFQQFAVYRLRGAREIGVGVVNRAVDQQADSRANPQQADHRQSQKDLLHHSRPSLPRCYYYCDFMF